MQDAIIKGNGNSRFLKTVAAALSLYPTYEEFLQALVAGNFPIDLNGINADGWTQQGTPLNKGNLLSDTVEKAIWNNIGNRTVNDALSVLGDVGNIHVWKRDTTATGVTDYPTSTDRNAFGEGFQDYQPAGYTLGEWRNIYVFASTNTSGSFTSTYGDASEISVSGNGVISADFPNLVAVGYNSTSATELKGKFVALHPSLVDVNEGETVFFVSANSAVTTSTKIINGQSLYVVIMSAQPVIGYPETGSAYLTYLGALGDKVRIETGSYVGTGVVGGSNANQNSITFDFMPHIIIITAENGPNNTTDTAMFFRGLNYYWGMFRNGVGQLGTASISLCGTVNFNDKILTWYGGNAVQQFNTSGITYSYLAIG